MVARRTDVVVFGEEKWARAVVAAGPVAIHRRNGDSVTDRSISSVERVEPASDAARYIAGIIESIELVLGA